MHLFLFVTAQALFFCTVLLSDFMPSVFGAYADQRLLLTLSLIALIAIALLRLHTRRMIIPALIGLWPYLLLVSSFLLSALQHTSSPFFLVEPVFYTLYFLAFGITGYAIQVEGRAKEAVQALVVVAVISCFFYAAVSIMVYLFALTDKLSHFEQFIPWGFANVRYWSQIAAWVLPLLPLCLLVLSWKENRIWQLGVTFTAATWWWMLFMSSSRGAVVGLLTGFVLVVLFFGRCALPWVKLYARFVFCGVIIWLLLSVVIPSLFLESIHIRGVKGDSSGRVPLWVEAWNMSLQNFPFGMGPQSWLTHDILTGAYRESSKLGHPHNMYLMWAAEYGWISIAGLIMLCGVALKNLWLRMAAARAEGNGNGLCGVALTASVTAAMVHGSVSAVFIAPGSMLVGLCVLTAFWAFVTPHPIGSDREYVVRRSKRSWLGGYLFVLMFVLVSTFWFKNVLVYRQAMELDRTFYDDEVSLRQLPRFWLHGNFPRHPSQMPNANSNVSGSSD